MFLCVKRNELRDLTPCAKKSSAGRGLIALVILWDRDFCFGVDSTNNQQLTTLAAENGPPINLIFNHNELPYLHSHSPCILVIYV